jgi:anti-anti-sigma factor
MFECVVSDNQGYKSLLLKGRIDALTSPDIEKEFNALILSGERIIIADLAGVDYISSAGLRVFLGIQKRLKKAGGQVILFRPAGSVLEVFNISGMTKMFRIVSSIEEIGESIRSEEVTTEVVSGEFEGIVIEYMKFAEEKGSFSVVGSQDNLAGAAYTERDVVTVKPSDMQFGTGLATFGEKYEDYKGLFGESMMINRNFFFYPAVKHPVVDFMIDSHVDANFTYKFLHGFGFSGPYQYVLSFNCKNGFVEIDNLIKAIFDITDKNILGIVLLAESKGIMGMHLKKAPIAEQRPDNGKDIFDPVNFPEWIDFPIEPADINNIIAGTGIAIRDRSLVRSGIKTIISEGGFFHIHAGIFEKGPLSKQLKDFEKELNRVLSELQIYKVQHILGKSRLSWGLAGIIELQE